MKFIFLQTGAAPIERLIGAVSVMGLRRNVDYLLTDKVCEARDAVTATEPQIFFCSASAYDNLRQHERCALIKDVNPAALYITLSTYKPGDEELNKIDGWIKRELSNPNFLLLQLTVWHFTKGMPAKELLKEVKSGFYRTLESPDR